jgi:hypothetical protein
MAAPACVLAAVAPRMHYAVIFNTNDVPSPVSGGLVAKLELVWSAEGSGRKKNRHHPPC